LGAVHGLAGPIGGRFPAPHGAICAILLAPVMAANLHALREREPRHPSIARYEEIARRLTANPEASTESGLEWLRALVAEFRIPRLRTYGLGEPDIAPLVSQAARASSMKANPVVLTGAELANVLRSAL